MFFLDRYNTQEHLNPKVDSAVWRLIHILIQSTTNPRKQHTANDKVFSPIIRTVKTLHRNRNFHLVKKGQIFCFKTNKNTFSHNFMSFYFFFCSFISLTIQLLVCSLTVFLKYQSSNTQPDLSCTTESLWFALNEGKSRTQAYQYHQTKKNQKNPKQPKQTQIMQWS